MLLKWDEKEKYNYTKYFKTRRERIVELSNVKVYGIIKELIKRLPKEDIMLVIDLAESSKRVSPDSFNHQLQHVYDSLEFSKEDDEILRKHLNKAEKERLQRKKERDEFEKKC